MSKPAPQPSHKPPPSIRIMCPNLVCKAVLAVPSIARGKMVRCKSCGTCIRVPDAAGGETSAA